MKRQPFVIVTTLSLLVMVTFSSVYAQSDMRSRFNIPFEFAVQEKVLPAGEYIVSYATQGVLVIQSVDRRVSQVFLTLSTQARTTQDKSSLVFNQY